MSGHKSLNILKRDVSHSNLNLFKEGKVDITKIYANIYDYMKDCNKFVNELVSSGNMFANLLSDEDKKKFINYLEKVKSIQTVVSRNQMKCAFFGRTSNGKSTTINAILGEKILPAGMGHTTSCFLEIQGTSENQGFLYVTYPNDEKENQYEPVAKPIESISELASDVSSKKVSIDALIKIFWPNSKCSLLCEDVTFIDSPGIDVEVDIDKWIDICCLDADVFVYVANAESTINTAEKKFFYKVRDKLSKPNIFIVNNRWDASAVEEPEVIEQTKKQHMEKFMNFLTKELKVCSKTEAENRIYFVSAKEVLLNRTKKNSGDVSVSSPMPINFTDGWQGRLLEFTNFEKNLERVLSETATKTKFSAHCSEASDIIADIKSVMEKLYDHCQEQRSCAMNLTQRINKEIEKLIVSQKECYRISQSKIQSLSSKVAEKVAKSLHDELSHLYSVIDLFKMDSFSEDSQYLTQYKMKLGSHVQEALCHKLEVSCANDIIKLVSNTSQELIKRYQDLANDLQLQERIARCRIDQFKPEFRVDCTNYHSDFHEDLSFKFSLGPVALLKKLFRYWSTNANRNNNFLASNNHITGSATSSSMLPEISASISDVLNFRSTIASNSGKIALVGMLGCGVLIKTLSWRVLAGVGVVYGGLYFYEYTSYTSQTREKLFKSQYSSYLVDKLRLTMDSVSRNSAIQSQWALKSMVNNINSHLDSELERLKTNQQQYERDCDKLQTEINNTKTLKNKADFLVNDIANFTGKYLD